MLELRGITAGYGDTIVLRDVSLAVPAGCVVALLGPNGAGKTTLLRVASGLLRPRRGEVLLHDRNVTGFRPHARAAAGLCHIPEGRGIFRDLSVRENLVVQARPGAEEQTIAAAVEIFPVLGERLRQAAGTLSGGEQQMLALARALAGEADVVLLDEVSMGLAPLIVGEIFDALVQFRARGTALLLVEQYVHRALELADFVFVLARGRIVFAGESGEVEGEDLVQRYLGVAVA
jgi:branched-chain amino acid transport system ATP-binding protein